jgi:probable addiction module antidote protein
MEDPVPIGAGGRGNCVRRFASNRCVGERRSSVDIAKALGAVARARGGMAQLSRETGIAREALYRALSETGNPELGTALKVMHALGAKLTVSFPA